MALLITTDNRPIFLSAEIATQLWFVKTGERQGTPKTRAKVNKIAKWHLNRETAPASYLEQNPVMEHKKVRGHDNVIQQGRLPYVD